MPELSPNDSQPRRPSDSRFGPGLSLESPERERHVELLLCTAAVFPSEHAAARLRALAAGEVDWDWILGAAEANRITPLLHRSLTRLCPEAVPDAVLAELKARIDKNAARNRALVATLHELLPAFEQAGLRAIPFKGPLLASAVYGDISLRQCWDLDLIVAPAGYRASLTLLESLGYSLIGRFDWEFTVRNDRNRAKIDVHESTAPRHFVRCIPFDTMWGATESVLLEGIAVRSLSTEHLMATLCIQIAKDFSDGRVRLSKICDIAELLRASPDLDWVGLRECMQSPSMLHLGILLAGELVDADIGGTVPAELARAAAADHAAREAADRIVRTITTKDATLDGSVFLAGDRWRDRLRSSLLWCTFKLRYVVRMALTPSDKDRAFVALPASMAALYYLVRPVRLLVDIARAPGRMVRGVAKLLR